MNRTVLYIEDDVANIRLVERLLRRHPHTELRVATTARGGVAAAVDGQPALILLDNRLPDATGGDVLRQLASSAAAGIPVVVISGDSGQGSVDEFLAAGAADFLPKPFDIHRFGDVINRYLPPAG